MILALPGPTLTPPAGLSVLHLALLPINKRKRMSKSALLRDWEGAHGSSACFEERAVVNQRVLPAKGRKETRLKGETNAHNLAAFKSTSEYSNNPQCYCSKDEPVSYRTETGCAVKSHKDQRRQDKRDQLCTIQSHLLLGSWWKKRETVYPPLTLSSHHEPPQASTVS